MKMRKKTRLSEVEEMLPREWLLSIGEFAVKLKDAAAAATATAPKVRPAGLWIMCYLKAAQLIN